MRKIGYARVSTSTQNLDRQIGALRRALLARAASSDVARVIYRAGHPNLAPTEPTPGAARRSEIGRRSTRYRQQCGPMGCPRCRGSRERSVPRKRVARPTAWWRCFTPVTLAVSTKIANRTRFSSMLRWARWARPAQLLISASPSRLPASVGRPTCSVAPLTAMTAKMNVNAADQIRYQKVGRHGVIPRFYAQCRPLTEPGYGRMMDSKILGDVAAALTISKTDPRRLLLVSRQLRLSAHTLAGLNGQPTPFLRAFHDTHPLSLGHR